MIWVKNFLYVFYYFILFFFYRGHKSYIICAAILDTFVFTGSADMTIKKWSLTTNECLFTYESHTSKIHKILATENLLFTTSNDKTAKVWHTNLTKQANRDRPLIRTFKVYYLLDKYLGIHIYLVVVNSYVYTNIQYYIVMKIFKYFYFVTYTNRYSQFDRHQNIVQIMYLSMSSN